MGRITESETLFHQFYNKYYRILVLYALKIIPTQDVAEDIVQEAFSNLLERDIKFETETSARSYIYTSVHHLCIDTLKHQGVINDFQSASSNVFDFANPDESEINKDEVLRRILEMIDNMPPRQREVFLHLMEGRKAKEIAIMMNVSENTVKMQKKRGINMLRQKLSSHDFSVFLSLF